MCDGIIHRLVRMPGPRVGDRACRSHALTHESTPHVCQRGQSTIEYALGLAIVVAGFIAMQFYLKHGIEGRVQRVGQGFGFVYAPKRTVADVTLTVTQQQTDTFKSEPDPADATKQIETILSETQQDESKQEGFEQVDVSPGADLFN